MSHAVRNDTSQRDAQVRNARPIHEALHVHHPLGDRQLRPANQRVTGVRERALAVPALPTLGAVRVMTLLDDGDGTAARARQIVVTG